MLISRQEHLVVAFAALTKPSVYVEIGIGDGGTFREVSRYSSEAYGCDVKMRVPEGQRIPNGSYFDGESRIFLAGLRARRIIPDLVFIDGDHTHDGARLDLIGVLPILRPDGVVFMHDTWPLEEDMAGIGNSVKPKPWFGDVYKVADWASKNEANLNIQVCTLPALNMTVIRKGRRAAPWIQEIAK